MPKEEIETLTAWVDAGMPKGNDRDLPQPIDWPKGWTHGTPDQVFTMPEDFEGAGRRLFALPTLHGENRLHRRQMGSLKPRRDRAHPASFITSLFTCSRKARLDSFPRTAHWAVLVGWAPGDLGLMCPPDTALRVPKGTTLMFEMHYTPNGMVTKDRSSVGVTYAKEPPKFELQLNAFANDGIQIPPHDPHYRAEASFRMRADARLISAVPHMHWRGKNYFYEAIYPDGRRETLLSVPRWDFNWQERLRLSGAGEAAQGDTSSCHCPLGQFAQ